MITCLGVKRGPEGEEIQPAALRALLALGMRDIGSSIQNPGKRMFFCACVSACMFMDLCVRVCARLSAESWGPDGSGTSYL